MPMPGAEVRSAKQVLEPVGRVSEVLFGLIMVLSTFPVVIPLIAMRRAAPALRVSNRIAIALLFVAGHV
jgi:hypothetical protein